MPKAVIFQEDYSFFIHSLHLLTEFKLNEVKKWRLDTLNLVMQKKLPS